MDRIANKGHLCHVFQSIHQLKDPQVQYLEVYVNFNSPVLEKRNKDVGRCMPSCLTSTFRQNPDLNGLGSEFH